MASYRILRRVEFMLGGRKFVAMDVEFDCPPAVELGLPLGSKRVERELYVVDNHRMEQFVGYIGSLHLLDARLAPLQSRAFDKLEEERRDYAQFFRAKWPRYSYL